MFLSMFLLDFRSSHAVSSDICQSATVSNLSAVRAGIEKKNAGTIRATASGGMETQPILASRTFTDKQPLDELPTRTFSR